MTIRDLPPRNLADRFSQTPRASAAPAAVEAGAENAAPPPGWSGDAAVVAEAGGVSLSGSIQDRLPPQAAEKLDDLRIASQQLWDACRAETDHVREAADAYARAKTIFERLERTYREGHMQRRTRVVEHKDPEISDLEMHPRTREVREVTRVQPDNQRLDDERRKLDRLKAKRDRRIVERDRLASEADGLGALLRDVEKYLGHLPRDTAVALHGGKSPKLPKGDLSAEIEKLRRQLIALDEDSADVLAAPRPSDEIKQALGRQIDSLARRGKPSITNLMNSLHAPEFATAECRLGVVSGSGGTGTAFGQIVNAAALVAWLDKDRLLTALESEVDAMAEDDLALTQQERRKRLTEFAQRRLTVERTECGLIDIASERGMKILPRPDTDPRAFLNLADELPQPKE